ncbi:folate-binding protein YgfZ [uncultured Roseibium sp.]|uniref:CAF17-like 4Fe-4S cluster assembly/insertion protein YgfZ n=1 Tax=uncultured Roseibium sp. TaxID=1936171 RepID=UPI0025978866|nr:folate-binding protein YgfZ [uncultured Roseibium sp.]
MSQLQFALLESRGLIRIGGEDATHFLQNLVTCDIEKLDADHAGFGALLTPQGKILFDFIVLRTDDGYLLDTPRETLADFAKRLTFYRLRAKVEIEALGADLGVAASWGDASPSPLPGHHAFDPRLAELGERHLGNLEDIRAALLEADGQQETPEAYASHRIALGVPESLSDYGYSELFPHDADMDQLNGVSFSKGCYVGQEVVSRVQHRATARKRMIAVSADTDLPEAGTVVLADGKAIGTLGSSSQANGAHVGIALVRLDKAQAARDKGAAFQCGDVAVALDLPSWAGFTWPADTSDA